MKNVMVVLLSATALYAAEDRARDFQRVAAIATVMLDGDVCLRIQTARSLKYASIEDPRDKWRAADNYDVDDASFIQTKKTLIRLAHLCPRACDVNLWMPLPKRDRIQIVIRNVHEISQFWGWGDLDQPIPTEMKQVLANGEPATVTRKPGMISVLSPVRDSLGKIVAVAEVVSQDVPDPRENVK